jgi:hypothetical protein
MSSIDTEPVNAAGSDGAVQTIVLFAGGSGIVTGGAAGLVGIPGR